MRQEEMWLAALRDMCMDIQKAITDVRRNASTVAKVVIAGDFNRHRQLRGGDEVFSRQGGADPISDLMSEFGFGSLSNEALKHVRQKILVTKTTSRTR